MLANVFNAKVINNKNELNRTPFMAPETRGGGSFVIAGLVQTFSEQIVGELAGLGQTITAADNFIIHPTIMNTGQKIILINDFLRNVRQFDAYIFRPGHGRLQIEVFCIKTCKPGIAAGQDTVDHELDQIERTGGSADVARVLYMATRQGDPGTVGIGLLRSDFTNNHGVADVLASVLWYVFISDGPESVGAFYALVAGSLCAFADTLAEAAQFVGI